jgi:hypothetical protein
MALHCTVYHLELVVLLLLEQRSSYGCQLLVLGLF